MPLFTTLRHARRAVLDVVHQHAARVALRSLLLLAIVGYFAFGIGIIALRYLVLPDIEKYRPDIEQAASFGLGRRVTIQSVEADWRGLNPYLALRNVAIADEAGRPALQLGLVESTLSWSSLWHLGLRQQSLVLWHPDLVVRRDRGGQLYVAGIPLSKTSGDGRAADWLLGQHEIAVRDAAITWIDEQRDAPELALAHVEFLLDNAGERHRFALRAQPPREHASALDLRGDLYGETAGDFASWRGQVYANLPYADLTAWRAWVDYPFDLRQGRGGVRVWAEFGAGQLRALTTDVGLAEVVARLGPQQQVLELPRLQGRFQYSQSLDNYTVSGSNATLRTSTGVAMDDADFSVRLSSAQTHPGGEIHANNVDLQGLAQLAEFLPLDPRLLATLLKYTPQGKVYQMAWNWTGPPDKPLTYSLQSRFSGLGVAASEATPGFSGISGNVKADTGGGTLQLDAHNAAVDLPMLFEDPHVRFDALSGSVGWKLPATGPELQFGNLTFSNADAAGSANGSYRSVAGAPGFIDLTARLTRADGRQAVRYLPKKLEKTREWLGRALQAGTSPDVRLRLKGDLTHYPFPEDKDGIFQITAVVSGARLEYGESWPVVDNINGELDFHGRRMDINASSGTILGTHVGRTKVEIPDMLTKEKELNITGAADGPTSEFLRFIELSPVSRMIDDFTRDMRAAGNGKLTLKLGLPLPQGKPHIAGSFQFIGDQIVVEPSVPPLAQVTGRLDFSENGASARNITANFLGGPTAINASTRTDAAGNTISVTGQGTANMQNLERALEYPWLKKLSGSALWRASIVVRKRAVDIVFDSTLAGIGSDLPDPLHKSAAETLPLRIERHVVPQEGARDGPPQRQETWALTLGKLVSAQWVAHSGAEGSEIQRAIFAFNETAPLPARGLAVAGHLPVLDVDQWRDLALIGGEAKGREIRVDLKLAALDALGRRFNDVDFHTALNDGTWHSSIKAREMEGDIDWQPKGHGKVTARLKQFTLPEASPHAQELAKAPPAAAAADSGAKELPELDLVADNFIRHDRSLGRLQLAAANVGRDWKISQLELSSPDATLKADGVWQNYSNQPHTTLNLHLQAGDTGKLLERLGFAGTMRRGQATLEGELSWNGSPQNIDYPSLSGNLVLEAKKGQFSKIEPGIGKLLGILSLQSIARRLSFDFDDVFRDGFAFDQIAGKVAIARGVMTTQDLTIDGPSAKVHLAGSTSLVTETQDLRVKVEPIIGDTASLLTAIVNPVIGIGTLLINRLSNNAVGRALGYEYHVTGTWNEPKVEKLSGPRQAREDAAIAAPAGSPGPAAAAAPAALPGAKP